MNTEKEPKIPPLTLLQSLLFSEIGRYQKENGSSFMILEASRHFSEYLDKNSPVNKNRQEPFSFDVLFQVLENQACNVNINIYEDESDAEPIIVAWPYYAQELPAKFVIRRHWNETNIELDVAELVNIYRAQRYMSEKSTRKESIFFHIPEHFRQEFEEQLAEAGYELPRRRSMNKQSRGRPLQWKQDRAGAQRKSARPTKKKTAQSEPASPRG